MREEQERRAEMAEEKDAALRAEQQRTSQAIAEKEAEFRGEGERRERQVRELQDRVRELETALSVKNRELADSAVNAAEMVHRCAAPLCAGVDTVQGVQCEVSSARRGVEGSSKARLLLGALHQLYISLDAVYPVLTKRGSV